MEMARVADEQEVNRVCGLSLLATVHYPHSPAHWHPGRLPKVELTSIHALCARMVCRLQCHRLAPWRPVFTSHFPVDSTICLFLKLCPELWARKRPWQVLESILVHLRKSHSRSTQRTFLQDIKESPSEDSESLSICGGYFFPCDPFPYDHILCALLSVTSQNDTGAVTHKEPVLWAEGWCGHCAEHFLLNSPAPWSCDNQPLRHSGHRALSMHGNGESVERKGEDTPGWVYPNCPS
jgi:hypothetical protein